MKAYLRQVRISPKKVNLVAQLVRGKAVKEALTTLKFTPKRAAPVLAKLIQSAVANAENNFKQAADNLVISKLLVNAGITMKRGRPVSRGRWHPVLKRTSRVTVEVAANTEKKPTKSKVVAKKTEVTKEKTAESKKPETAKTEQPAVTKEKIETPKETTKEKAEK